MVVLMLQLRASYDYLKAYLLPMAFFSNFRIFSKFEGSIPGKALEKLR